MGPASTHELSIHNLNILHAIMLILLALLLLSSSSSSSSSSGDNNACFESIISFGNSYTDTGNILLLNPPGTTYDCAHPPFTTWNCACPPYGRTFFHHPTGRCSDGRLVIDFLAESLGLPLVQPYIAVQNANFSSNSYESGVNFAVAGATALSVQLYDKGLILKPPTNVSLGIELEWFNHFFATIPEGRNFLERSLVLTGEIGVNDYNYQLTNGGSIVEIRCSVPRVVNYIGLTIRELIEVGAKTMLVPGIPPLGCSPLYLTLFKLQKNENDYYDPKTGCLVWLNELSEYHNRLLQQELSRIREGYPDILISYVDYYNLVTRLYRSPHEFGFRDAFQVCCGVGGPYNFDISQCCGSSPLVTSCDEPSRFVNWDGIHLTEAAYKWMAQGLLEGSYTDPQITFSCNSKSYAKRLYKY